MVMLTGKINEPARMASLCLAILTVLVGVAEARDKGDDIILTKGKIIMRGGKGKGNIILDPGSGGGGSGGGDQSHHMMPMMSLMGHFNPYAFYPMVQQHQPQMMVQPIYIEDHSSMQHHDDKQPEHQEYHQHQEQQYHEHEPQHHHYEHHEMEQHHYEPQQHQHQQDHHEQHEPQQHQEQDAGQQYDQQQHELAFPMLLHQHHQHQYEPEESGQHQQQHHQGYESQPMLGMMMHGGSGAHPQVYGHQGLAAMQALQQPAVYVQHPNPEQQLMANPQAQMMAAALAAAQEEAIRNQQQAAAVAHHQDQQQQLQQQQQHQQPGKESSTSETQTGAASETGRPTNAVESLLEKSANNPLVRIIKPLFKRNKESSSSAATAGSKGSQKN